MSLGNNQFPYNFDESAKLTAWNVLCLLREEDSKGSVNSASVQNVCARTVLTDSSSDKQLLQGTVTIWRYYCHIQFCVVAWEMEDNFCLKFSIFVFNSI